MSCLWKIFPITTSFESPHQVSLRHQEISLYFLRQRLQRYIWFEETHAHSYRYAKFIRLIIKKHAEYTKFTKFHIYIYYNAIFFKFQEWGPTNAHIATKHSPNAVHWRVMERKCTDSHLNTHTSKDVPKCTFARNVDTPSVIQNNTTFTWGTTIRTAQLYSSATTRGNSNSQTTKYHKQSQQLPRPKLKFIETNFCRETIKRTDLIYNLVHIQTEMQYHPPDFVHPNWQKYAKNV